MMRKSIEQYSRTVNKELVAVLLGEDTANDPFRDCR
jgi:hypothetical protein